MSIFLLPLPEHQEYKCTSKTIWGQGEEGSQEIFQSMLSQAAPLIHFLSSISAFSLDPGNRRQSGTSRDYISQPETENSEAKANKPEVQYLQL